MLFRIVIFQYNLGAATVVALWETSEKWTSNEWVWIMSLTIHPDGGPLRCAVVAAGEIAFLVAARAFAAHVTDGCPCDRFDICTGGIKIVALSYGGECEAWARPLDEN